MAVAVPRQVIPITAMILVNDDCHMLNCQSIASPSQLAGRQMRPVSVSYDYYCTTVQSTVVQDCYVHGTGV